MIIMMQKRDPYKPIKTNQYIVEATTFRIIQIHQQKRRDLGYLDCLMSSTLYIHISLISQLSPINIYIYIYIYEWIYCWFYVSSITQIILLLYMRPQISNITIKTHITVQTHITVVLICSLSTPVVAGLCSPMYTLLVKQKEPKLFKNIITFHHYILSVPILQTDFDVLVV